MGVCRAEVGGLRDELNASLPPSSLPRHALACQLTHALRSLRGASPHQAQPQNDTEPDRPTRTKTRSLGPQDRLLARSPH